MSADAPPATPPPVIRLGIGSRALLELLCLGAGVRIIGASMEGQGATVTLYLEHPGAPEGADTMSPVYERDNGPGPAHLAGVEWFKNGARLRP